MRNRYRHTFRFAVLLMTITAAAGQEPEMVRDPDSYALYGLLVPSYWATTSNATILLQRETEKPHLCQNLAAPSEDWQSVLGSFHAQNTRVQLLQPLLTTDALYRLISRAEIEADDVEYVAVSAVGFNQLKSKAILYVRLRGGGVIYFMEKRDGKWVHAPISSCGWGAGRP